MAKKIRGIPLKTVLKKELEDPEFRFYFERAKAVRAISNIVKNARLYAGMTQSQLAKRAKTSQTVIARLESGSDSRIPSMELLERIAYALRARLVVAFEYKAAA